MIQDLPEPRTAATALPAAVKSLLRHFHRQSPIRGGSLLITIFGDSIAPRGGAVTLGSLIALTHPFGLTERLVRTSVARLARDGWLVARRDGRRSEYRLTPTGQERFAAATRRIYGEIPSSWDGHWTVLILPPTIGGRRQDLREELRWLGFGQISPGVFAHPSWGVTEARAGLSGVDGAANGLLLTSTSEGSQADRKLAASGWDLGDLTRRYRRFLDTFTPVMQAVASSMSTPAPPSEPTSVSASTPPGKLTPTSTPAPPDRLTPTATPAPPGSPTPTGAPTPPSLPTPASALVPPDGTPAESPLPSAGAGALTRNALTPEGAFVIRTLLIHEYRKIHLQDPLLPQALLPPDWVGSAAYELSKRLYSAAFPAAERYLSNTANTVTNPLPVADASAHARFGGLTPM